MTRTAWPCLSTSTGPPRFYADSRHTRRQPRPPYGGLQSIPC